MGTAEFSVLSEELRAAGAQVSRAVEPVSCYHLPASTASAETFGHVELAQVFNDFCRCLDAAVTALGAEGDQAAATLEETAATYEVGDQCVTDGFTRLSGRLGPIVPR